MRVLDRQSVKRSEEGWPRLQAFSRGLAVLHEIFCLPDGGKYLSPGVISLILCI